MNFLKKSNALKKEKTNKMKIHEEKREESFDKDSMAIIMESKLYDQWHAEMREYMDDYKKNKMELVNMLFLLIKIKNIQ